MCTEVCSPDAPCDQGGRPTGCFGVNSPGLEQRCTGGSIGAGEGVCLARCESDSDCPSGARCHAGACIALGEADAAAGSLPDPHDFGAIDAAADFASSVDLPDPQPDIEGDLSKLVGEWIELTESGEPCTPEAPGPRIAGSVCLHLIVERGARGRFVGHAFWEPDGHNDPGATGPFAPATDPNVGYPVEVSPEKYDRLRSPAPGIDYRALDGVFDGTRLSFWISALDLWSGWCALQTPHLWNLGSSHVYRCVPPSADLSNTNLGTPISACDLCAKPICDCSSTPCAADLVYRRYMDLERTGESRACPFPVLNIYYQHESSTGTVR